VKLKKNGEIRVNELGSDMILRGKLESESGNLSYIGGKFDITQSVFRFLETGRRRPAVSAEAETINFFKDKKYKIKVKIAGTDSEFAEIDDLNPVFTSDPPDLNQQEISQIVTGVSSFTPDNMADSILRNIFRASTGMVNTVVGGVTGGRISIDYDIFSRDLSLQSPKTQSLLHGLEVKYSEVLSDNMSVWISTVFREPEIGKNNQFEQKYGFDLKLKDNIKFKTDYGPNSGISVFIETTQPFDIGSYTTSERKLK
jgi:hypothetical protein